MRRSKPKYYNICRRISGGSCPFPVEEVPFPVWLHTSPVSSALGILAVSQTFFLFHKINNIKHGGGRMHSALSQLATGTNCYSGYWAMPSRTGRGVLVHIYSTVRISTSLGITLGLSKLQVLLKLEALPTRSLYIIWRRHLPRKAFTIKVNPDLEFFCKLTVSEKTSSFRSLRTQTLK